MRGYHIIYFRILHRPTASKKDKKLKSFISLTEEDAGPSTNSALHSHAESRAGNIHCYEVLGDVFNLWEKKVYPHTDTHTHYCFVVLLFSSQVIPRRVGSLVYFCVRE